MNLQGDVVNARLTIAIGAQRHCTQSEAIMPNTECEDDDLTSVNGGNGAGFGIQLKALHDGQFFKNEGCG